MVLELRNPQHFPQTSPPRLTALRDPQVAPPPLLPIIRPSRLRGAAARLWRAVRRRSASLTGLPAMTITYSCVANGRAVLAELALTGGSYQVPAGRASGARVRFLEAGARRASLLGTG